MSRNRVWLFNQADTGPCQVSRYFAPADRTRRKEADSKSDGKRRQINCLELENNCDVSKRTEVEHQVEKENLADHAAIHNR